MSPQSRKANKMVLQASTTKATLNRPADRTDTSIVDTSSADTEWLRENMQQLIDNQIVMKQ